MNPVRVVLADDHEPMLATVARLLEPEFTIVATVHDGAALVEAVARLDPELVILDITMPIMDGVEAARRIRASGAGARIVFLTIHQDDDYARVCMQAGGHGYVVKSLLATDLLVAIGEVMAGRSFVSGH